MAVAKGKFTELLGEDPSLEYSTAIQNAALIKGALFGEIIKDIKIPANEKISYVTVLADQIDFLSGIPIKGGTA